MQLAINLLTLLLVVLAMFLGLLILLQLPKKEAGITAAFGAESDAQREALKFFENEVRPLLSNRCYECHGEKKQKGGLRMDHIAHIKAGGEAGPAVVPGNLDKSLIIEAIRYKKDGSEDPDFVLNKPAYRKAQILVTGTNFGCGSSREHAPWALLDYGLRCIISTSFADIFYNNCFKNGILPIALKQSDVDKLMDDANRGANAIISIDLEKQEITGPDGGSIKFEIDPFRKHLLLNGLDDIGQTMQHAKKIDGYEAAQKTSQPWMPATNA